MQLNACRDSHGVGIALLYCLENRRWIGLMTEDREARVKLNADLVVSSWHIRGNWKISSMFGFDQSGSKVGYSTWTAHEHEPRHTLSSLASYVQMLSQQPPTHEESSQANRECNSHIAAGRVDPQNIRKYRDEPEQP